MPSAAFCPINWTFAAAARGRRLRSRAQFYPVPVQGSIAISKQPQAAELEACVLEAFGRVDEHPKYRKEP